MIKNPNNFRDLRFYASFDHGGDNNTTVKDLSPYGNDGTWNGSTATRLVSGKYGNAGDFNSANSDYVDFSSNYMIQSGEAYTVMLWLKNVDDSQEQVVINHKGTGGERDFIFSLRYNVNDIIFQDNAAVLPSNRLLIRATQQLPSDDTWEHWAIKCDENNKLFIFRNGVDLSAPDFSGSISPLNGFTIGSRVTTDRFFNGQMDEVRIYGRGLSAHEIQEIYLATSPPPTESVKQLMLYENFKAGGITADWTVLSGSFAVEYSSILSKFYLKCLTGGSLETLTPDWSGNEFMDSSVTVAGSPTINRNVNNISISMTTGDAITDVVVRRD